jgi:aminopeptidase
MASTQRVAKSIVGQSLRPKEYESVIISSYPHTLELAEQVALECQKAGADPLIVMDTDGLFYGQYKNYSPENLERVSAHCVGLLDYVNSYVWLGGPKDPGPMRTLPKDKVAANFRGEQAHYDKSLQKKPKSVGVAIGQVTRERARTYGFNYARWKAEVEAAIATSYRQMEALGKTVAGLLSSPVGVRVTADNGTDLRFRLAGAGAGRKPSINDGVVSDEDLAEGNPEANLPAGSVSVAPIEESANGTFVSDVPIPQLGRLIEGLAWTFKDGHIVDFTARKNLANAQVGWDTATGAKDMFGVLSLGLNRRAKPGFLHASVAAGAVTIGVGDNRSYDGKNASTWGFYGFLGTGTVEIAGKTVIHGGKWVI